MKFRAKASYDGTEFFGFQRQGAFRSVQGEIEAALQTVTGQSVTVYGAGRTDSGVHATGQVIAFGLEWRHSPEALQRALNVTLPQDAAVREVRRCDGSFSPRFDALSRTYEYTVYRDSVRRPTRDRYAWQVGYALDVAAMNDAAEGLIGEHDFAAFGSPTSESESTIRRVMRARWEERATPDGERDLVFTIEANAFLYRMVRRIVNALVKVGSGRIGRAAFVEALASGDQNRITGLAAAAGLCLTYVSYRDEDERQEEADSRASGKM
jgi:tRNA pseudouridine38-40 synthase